MAFFILILIGFCFYTFLRNQDLGTQINLLKRRIEGLEDQIRKLHVKIVSPSVEKPAPAAPAAITPPVATMTSKPIINCPKCWAPMEITRESCDVCGTWLRPATKPVTPAPLATPTASMPSAGLKCFRCLAPVEPTSEVCPQCGLVLKPALHPKAAAPTASSTAKEPPKEKTPTPVRGPILPPEPVKPAFKMPAIDWEQFMGVKLFAWLGGFALFLGMAFFVKYSIDHNMISPLMRVTIGFIIGVGTIIGGLALRKKGYDVTVHTLAASGISVLYADIFASRTLYGFLSNELAFGAMILVTMTAFLLSVRLNSKYVAILGMLGGFLTPPMLSTGVDHPIALFSYILLLDIGLAAVTIRQGWGFLLGMSSVATFLMEAGWTLKFFTPGKAWLAIGIYITFCIFFLIVSSLAEKSGAKDKSFQEPADYMPLLSMGFVGYLLSFPALGLHPGVIFTLLFSNLALMGWQAIRRSESQHPYALGSFISFVLLAVWTIRYMAPAMAILAAGLYLVLCLFTFFVSSRAVRQPGAVPTAQGVANFMPLAAFGLAFYFLTIPELGAHPLLIFSLMFVLAGMLAWRALYGKGSSTAHGLGVLAGFALLILWTASFMKPEKIVMASGIYLAYCLFHLFVSRVSDKKGIQDENIHSPADYLPLGSMAFVWYMLHFPALGHRPGIVLTVLLILGALSAYRALKRPSARIPYGLSGAASFFLLASWTVQYMRSSLLLWGLGYYMAFAVVHTLYPIVYQRLRPASKPLLAGFMAPILGLVLILVAMLACDLLSFLLWPFVLVLGLLGVALSWLAGSLLAAGGSVLLVMACFAVWLFRLPDAAGLSGVLSLLAISACAFFAWTLLVTRGKSLFAGNAFLSRAAEIPAADAAAFPALVVAMPFLLLIMVCIRLPLPNPMDVFLFALLLDVLLLALARFRKMELVVPAALVGTALLEWAWLGRNTPLAQPMTALGWALVFYGLFLVFPFLFRKHIRGTAPWVCSAVAGLAQWPLFWDPVNQVLGRSSAALVPAFFALPTLMSLIAVVWQEKDEMRLSKLAWFGGMTLFFVTLIIPIQFDKEWLTVGWTLEGAALLWLYRRVPHEGLKGWGLALLAICFARLAVNPSVLSYHARTGIPIMNWYLWVYGVGAISYYLAAYWLQPVIPAGRRPGSMVPPPAAAGDDVFNWEPILNSAGTILAFLLVNIEIADYFSTGSAITFNFSGNLAQDMAYSLSWGVFSILMLVAGIRQGSTGHPSHFSKADDHAPSNAGGRGARYASIGLLSVTLAKLFLHDIWRLGGLYRVASFIGLAVVLILVSFLYQKFVKAEEKPGGAS